MSLPRRVPSSAFGFLLLLAAIPGCCTYNPQSVTDLRSAREQVGPLYDGFTQAPSPTEETDIEQVKSTLTRVVRREGSAWPQCRATQVAARQALSTFNEDVAARRRRLPRTFSVDFVREEKTQLEQTIDRAIGAVEARKKG